MLSNKAKRAYIDSEGSRCPYCGSKDLEALSYRADGNYVAFKVDCGGCSKTWSDLYTLTDILED